MDGEAIKFVEDRRKAVPGSVGLRTQAPGRATTVSAVAEMDPSLPFMHGTRKRNFQLT